MSDPDEKQAAGWAFVSTRWSVIARAAPDGTQEAQQEALATLCRAYWRPVYAEIRRRGHAVEDAQDLTQDFFARLLRHESFGRADRERGRFRSYLLGALDFFLADARRRETAAKRDVRRLLPLDAAEAERWRAETEAPGPDPAAQFDHRWRVTILAQALRRLEESYADRAELFAALRPYLAAEATEYGYAEASETLGLSRTALLSAVSRLRRRYRELVREEVALTLANPVETEAELAFLFGA